MRSWDALHLITRKVDVRVWARGAIAFARADVVMVARKHLDRLVPMVLGAVILPERGTWVSLSFAAPAADQYDPAK